MKPCVIIWHKKGKWHKANKIFYTDEEINSYYKRNRNRVGVLMIVKTVADFRKLVRNDPKEFGYLVKRRKPPKKPAQSHIESLILS